MYTSNVIITSKAKELIQGEEHGRVKEEWKKPMGH